MLLVPCHRAKNIRNRPEVNQKISKTAMIKEMSSEMEKLRMELIAQREKNGIYISTDKFQAVRPVGIEAELCTGMHAGCRHARAGLNTHLVCSGMGTSASAPTCSRLRLNPPNMPPVPRSSATTTLPYPTTLPAWLSGRAGARAAARHRQGPARGDEAGAGGVRRHAGATEVRVGQGHQPPAGEQAE